MAGSDFVNQYLKKFADSVQNNTEAVDEFKNRMNEKNVVPVKLAVELIKKYSGDFNTFFQAKSINNIEEGYQGNILGLVSNTRCIEYEKDGRKRMRCVGSIEDKTGRLPFTEFTDATSRVSKGDFILLENATVGEFNNKPYLTISYRNEINVLEKSSLTSVAGQALKVRELGPNMYDLSIKGQMRTTGSKENVGKDAVTLYSGLLSDESGSISVQSWGTPLKDGYAEIRGASMKLFRDRLYLQIGKGTHITFVTEETGMYTNLEQLSESQKGVAEGEAIILKIFDRNPVISVCSVCQKIVKEDQCGFHPDAPAERILRMSMIVDDGFESPLVYAYQKVLETYVEGGKEKIKRAIETEKVADLVREIVESLKMKLVRYSIYGFRGSSGMYFEVQSLSIMDEPTISDEYKKLREGLM